MSLRRLAVCDNGATEELTSQRRSLCDSRFQAGSQAPTSSHAAVISQLRKSTPRSRDRRCLEREFARSHIGGLFHRGELAVFVQPPTNVNRANMLARIGTGKSQAVFQLARSAIRNLTRCAPYRQVRAERVTEDVNASRHLRPLRRIANTRPESSFSPQHHSASGDSRARSLR